MRLSQICIDRPVLSIVMSLVILVFGIIALGRLQYRELPDIDNPIVSVMTILPGAAPEVMETSVTQVIEDELVSIEGVRHITSVSREETSIINLEFELSRDLNVAASDVRDRVALAMRGLPDEVKAPIVSKANSSGGGMLWMDLGGGGLDQIELTTLVETQIEDRLTKLPGVATLYVAGQRRLAVRIWIDHHRLTARGLVVSDIADALRKNNVDMRSAVNRQTVEVLATTAVGRVADLHGERPVTRRAPRASKPHTRHSGRGALYPGRARSRG